MDRLKVEETLIAEANEIEMEEDEPEKSVIEEGAVTVKGCIPDATTFYDTYLNNILKAFPKRINTMQLTCGKCSSLVIDGEFKGSVTVCKSGKGIL